MSRTSVLIRRMMAFLLLSGTFAMVLQFDKAMRAGNNSNGQGCFMLADGTAPPPPGPTPLPQPKPLQS